MKALKRDLQSVVKNLKALTLKTERLAKRLDKLAKAPAVKKSVPKAKATVKKRVTRKPAAKKPTRVSATDTVLAIIKTTKKGIDTTTLKKKSKFSDKKIWNIINRLKKQGKIKSKSRGVYTKA